MSGVVQIVVPTEPDGRTAAPLLLQASAAPTVPQQQVYAQHPTYPQHAVPQQQPMGTPGWGSAPPPAPEDGKVAKVLATLGGVMVVGLLGVIGYLLLRENSQQVADPISGIDRPIESRTTVVDVGLDPDSPTSTQPFELETVPPTEAPTTGAELTDTQKRAAASARDYLAFRATSRYRVIEYLAYDQDDKDFSEEDAEIGVDSLGVDWNVMASKAAASYLESSAFSQKGLIRQLSSRHGEGFTEEQAAHGVNTLDDVDWSEQAKRYASQFAESTSVSRETLLRIMTGDSGGFEEDQAERGIADANIDFNEQAAKAAAEILEYDEDLNCEDLIDSLSGRFGKGFTDEEAAYGAGTTDAC